MEDFFAHLDDALTGADVAANLKAKADAGQIIPLVSPGFEERCPKCHGTGQFRSYSGRALGPCFTCKGKGTRTFRTSSAQRAKARDQRADRAERERVENGNRFKEENPAQWAWIEGRATKADAFALSLLEGIFKFGHLTERQAIAVDKAIARDAERAQQREERVAAAPTADVGQIEQALRSARQNGIKHPKLRLADFVFSLAGEESRNPGAIYVKAHGGDYLGKVAAGRFYASRECSTEASASILAAAADPHAAAVAYGHKFGSCSCCGRELSNPESVELGIGPICRERFGWG